MREEFDLVEMRAVAEAMHAFAVRCSDVAKLIGDKKHLDRHERSEVEELYKQLKGDLKEAAKRGTLSGKREPQTRIESAFYDPAVRKAHIALRPATNSHPIHSGWVVALWEAESEFSYLLQQMEGLLKRP